MTEPIARLNAALADRYRIEREIGSGGMATVYLAQDLKHDRKVAVKVLKPELAAVMGTDRFLAEIRTTANLTHPHILPLHDSGEADGFLFYVMPYVEGESLRQRLDRDGQLPLEEAVRIAGGVADALDYAHRQGVIHRDIKPANILFEDEQPVVTDFGIALAVSAAGKGRLTETGLSLGTPYYMSPEQAAGDQTPTAASDVYSLGCVLYEMLTGDPPHTGSSAQAILGKILLGEVTRPTKLRRTIPANVEGVILKALERLPADRFETVAELGAALKDRAFRHGVGVGAEGLGNRWRGLAIGLGIVAVLAVAVALKATFSPPRPPPVERYVIEPPGDGAISQWGRYFALAPDGSSMVYRDTLGVESDWQLWVLERGSVEARPLSGTQRARDVNYSPDGQWIAYQQGSNLVKRPIHRAGTVTLLEQVDGAWLGLAWLDDGTILVEKPARTLVRIPDDGSRPPETVGHFPVGGIRWVDGLPEARGALVMGFDGNLSVLDLQADSAWVVLSEVARAWYVATGHIAYVRTDGAVMAAPFDLRELGLGSERYPLFEGVLPGEGWAEMVMSREGTVVYLEGSAQDPSNRALVWVDRAGGVNRIDPEWGTGPYQTLALSPDGRNVAVQRQEDGGSQIYVKEFPGGPETRLTTSSGTSTRPTWSPDGATIAYTADEEGTYEARTVASDGRSVGSFETLLEMELGVREVLYTPDGQGIVFRHGTTGTADIGFLDLTTGTANTDLLATRYNEWELSLSPDGRWLAYSSNATGRYEVFVRPFPDVEADFEQVSLEGGSEPLWSRATSDPELFYRDGEGWMTAATYSADSVFNVVDRDRLFDASSFLIGDGSPGYAVDLTGDRFLMVLREEYSVGRAETPEPRMVMIKNWFTELKEMVGGGD